MVSAGTRPRAQTTMPTLEFGFRDRPLVTVRDRHYVLLDDLQPMLGTQLVPAADVTALLPGGRAHAGSATSVPAWYDGSGVCYVRTSSGPPSRVSVTDLPLWVGLDVQGGLAQLLQPA